MTRALGLLPGPAIRILGSRRIATRGPDDEPQREADGGCAAFDLVANCVRDDLHGTQQVVADAILALGLYTDTHAHAGLDVRITRSLYSTSLGRRRETLLNHWHRLHEAVGQQPAEAPSDRALRGATEPAVLRELANQLIRRDIYSVGSKPSSCSTRPRPRHPTGRPVPHLNSMPDRNRIDALLARLHSVLP